MFDVIVANPPYGTKWSGFEKEIKHDEKGQFPGGLPAVSDGQLLFMQHILWQLSNTGIAVEVHNGSTLFSGDAGSGESNIRKYIFNNDWVEAIIQMPQQEFFNTGIYTYLWIMNKNKPHNRKDKVALIDGSNGWAALRKSKGDKRREMKEEHRQAIVDALINFVDNDICKIYDREYFYYNKQGIKLYETNDNGISVVQTVCQDGDFEIKPSKLIAGEMQFEKFKYTFTVEETNEIMYINDVEYDFGGLVEGKWPVDELEEQGDHTFYPMIMAHCGFKNHRTDRTSINVEWTSVLFNESGEVIFIYKFGKLFFAGDQENYSTPHIYYTTEDKLVWPEELKGEIYSVACITSVEKRGD